MASIDIRDVTERVDTIIFADAEVDYQRVANTLSKTGDGIQIYDGGEYVLVKTKTDAENLIKALQKAIELGWVA